ncbi:hypothetical protein [Methylobacterium segetis]|uniref:hypothetical protein n=1 Tax=Methylobacterium segetis TaxID=2488750 RepID=UPI001FDEADF4|nr:hypothetical protein [Methylobacterium segetis]
MAARAHGQANGTAQEIARHLRAGLAAGALLLTAGAAQAQYLYEDAILSPRAVAWRLTDRGFSGFSRPRFDGQDYVVEAFAPNGARVRLFVDARDGAIVGRQRLDAAPVARLVRPAPGYGWTEADARLVPPADIPQPGGRILPPRPELYGRIEGAPAPRRDMQGRDMQGRDLQEGNPLSVNPDAKARPEPQRRTARLAPPPAAKPAETRPAARTAPEAPQPSLKPAEAAKEAPRAPEQAKPETREAPVAAAEPPKAAPAPQTPAAVQPPPKEAAEKAQEIKPAEAKPAEAKASEPKAPEVKAAEAEHKPGTSGWQDPPEGKRNVRVIGGATVVTRPSGEASSTD